MLNTTLSDPFAQRLATYAKELDRSANKWTAIDQNVTTADRFIDSADRYYDQAWHPQRQASWDNERTDSSWHGRELQRQFRYGGQEVDRSEDQIRRGSSELQGISREVQQTDQNLDQLVAEMRQANDPRLATVLQAAQEVDRAQSNLQGVNSSFHRFDSSARWVDQAAWRADSPIQQICFDRPGINVSHHAHQVGNSLRDIERELQSMDWALRDADRYGDQGQAQLRGAAQTLLAASGQGAE
jgi:hypothetical protein